MEGWSEEGSEGFARRKVALGHGGRRERRERGKKNGLGFEGRIVLPEEVVHLETSRGSRGRILVDD